MSFSFLGALSSLLPGYIQGRRQAIQDNWQDLQNYNNVQAGEQANAFTGATWQPRVDMMFNAGRRDNMNTVASGLNMALMAAGFPRQYWNAQMGNMWGPMIDWQNYMLQNRAQQMGMTMQPGAFLNWMSGGNQQMPQMPQGTNPTPSGIRG